MQSRNKNRFYENETTEDENDKFTIMFTIKDMDMDRSSISQTENHLTFVHV